MPEDAPVPQSLPDPNKPVLFVTLGSLQEVPKDLHPAPDPLLLFSKAATIWGKMTNFSMIANEITAEDDEDEEDSLDEVAEEALYRKYHKAPPIPMEISVASPEDRAVGSA